MVRDRGGDGNLRSQLGSSLIVAGFLLIICAIIAPGAVGTIFVILAIVAFVAGILMFGTDKDPRR